MIHFDEQTQNAPCHCPSYIPHHAWECMQTLNAQPPAIDHMTRRRIHITFVSIKKSKSLCSTLVDL